MPGGVFNLRYVALPVFGDHNQSGCGPTPSRGNASSRPIHTSMSAPMPGSRLQAGCPASHAAFRGLEKSGSPSPCLPSCPETLPDYRAARGGDRIRDARRSDTRDRRSTHPSGYGRDLDLDRTRTKPSTRYRAAGRCDEARPFAPSSTTAGQDSGHRCTDSPSRCSSPPVLNSPCYPVCPAARERPGEARLRPRPRVRQAGEGGAATGAGEVARPGQRR